MKKFDPEKELNLVKTKNDSYITSKFNSAFIPLLVIGCSVLALIGVAFSYRIIAEDQVSYTVKIDIINGKETQYVKKVPEGSFRDKISSSASFGSLKCIEGNLSYDPITETIYSPYINHNTTCIISFRDDGIKELTLNELEYVNDNYGTSYYYKADSINNYVSLENMMFRIVRINGDGTIRLILDDRMLTSDYGAHDFVESNAYNVLNEWFKNNLSRAYYVVEGDFDITNYTDVDYSTLVSLDGYITSKVGLLSVREAALISDKLDGESYLKDTMYLSNPNGTSNIYAFYNGSVKSVNPSEKLALRPVINIKGNLVGEGTIENPYVLEEE